MPLIPNIDELELLEKRAAHKTHGFYHTMEQCEIFVFTMLLSVFIAIPLGLCGMATVMYHINHGEYHKATIAAVVTGIVSASFAILIFRAQRLARISACKSILNEP